MNKASSSLRAVLPLAAMLLHGCAAWAVTFTNDAAISFNNTNYDGLDIVVSNCTLTVDGLHAFASLQVLNAGKLTHDYAPVGAVYDWRGVTNEPQVLSLTNVAALSNANVMPSSIVVQDATGAVIYTNGVDYVIGSNTNSLTTLLLTTNSAIAEGSTNLVSYTYLAAAAAGGLSLAVTGDVIVAQGGTINVDGRGYGGGSGFGPGHSNGDPQSGSGAGHGGLGGQGGATGGPEGGGAYDSIQQPDLLGSGGGYGYGGEGAAGGGSIKLVVGGMVRVDGTVSAKGADALNTRAGGGSGGSIWVRAQAFAGGGQLTADGGAGEPSQGGGGGGGRISLQYDASSFTGLIAARGGNGYLRGGAGTIYTRANSQLTGLLLVDNGGHTGAATPFNTAEVLDLTVRGRAVVSPGSGYSFQTIGNLLVASNAWIRASGYATLAVTGNATIEAGGGITADGLGNGANQGVGAGRYYSTSYGQSGGGGGYGGYGAAGGGTTAYGGSSYGLVATPTDLGSGGGCVPNIIVSPGSGGGAGGGAIRLNVAGLLLLDGRISADGGAGVAQGSGGGSGGSVWLTVGTLAGAGTISASGGMGNGSGVYSGGGGGGGRVAVQYGSDLFFGVMAAQGAGGSAWGGAGTIYTKADNQSWGQVLADNGGHAGTNTSWSSIGTLDLTVKGGAVVSALNSQTYGALLVASNGWLSVANQLLTVTGNATIQAGGGIIADGLGYGGSIGPGAGRAYSSSDGYVGGGAGYGGCGAAGQAGPSSSAIGGTTYGLVNAPVDAGSGGGAYGPARGGAGGGAIRLNVTGALRVDGRISANGLAGPGSSGGGGSGGTVSLNVGTIAGSGIISANGGMGNYLGGGGGGGRIAILHSSYGFSGIVSAYGGGGYATGGAGTVYFKANSQSWGLVVADNGGQSGTNTSWLPDGTLDLTVSGGAAVAPPSSQNFGTLLVASNGWLIISNQVMTVSGNATVQAGGGILADGRGYAAGSGPGAGRNAYVSNYGYIGGGAGFGGYGAAGTRPAGYTGNFLADGGTTYGLAISPVDIGSGGGYTGTGGTGCAGGGVIRLTVMGVLQVDGRISASGNAGGNPSMGGGAGGSINLSVGTLAGSGAILVNGGAGNALGGGGGGGRIAISCTSANYFTGLTSAYGGGGGAAGGAGTIYMQLQNAAGVSKLVVVDNGGQTGTNTSWTSGGTYDLTLRNGASLAMPSTSQTIGSLVIGSNGWLYLTGAAGTAWPTLYVNGNATIQPGGGIIADGGGYSGAKGDPGPGAGGLTTSSGAYVAGGGGFGGGGAASGGSPSASGGSAYGLVSSGGPGSGGGTYSTYFVSGAGGGAVSLNVSGTLRVDGRISSAGGAGTTGNAGGGSGGGIVLTVGTLLGAGVIAANGGAGIGLGGGGGGGRIAITYAANAFSGVMSAYGGGGYAWGGAGTIYTKSTRQSWGQVLADNGGQAGANTGWYEADKMDLVVTGGAVVSPQFSQTFANLLVTSNAWVSVSNQVLVVTSNATVEAGGGIIADAAGYGAGQGPGAGKFAYNSLSGYVGSGGGHGGCGAASGGSIAAPGGIAYGLATAPFEFGSSGGAYHPSDSPPGVGGGAIRMSVTGALLVNGRISANGGAAPGQDSGGGSGGSVWLTVGTLAGSGTIAANGGAGNELGGGGGGGSVSLQYGVNAFGGGISAYGGGGNAWGGAGTIYAKANNQVMGQMLVDNGGHSGTNTPVSYLPPFDLTVSSGAVANPASPYLLLSNLFITAGGAFTCLSTQTNLDLVVLRTATVETGGAIVVDGKGFGAGVGPGAGASTNFSVGSGAGYGGNGGASSLLPGGGTYGSAQQPVDRGSGGGRGSAFYAGGSEGGGAIRLTVGGALTVNGRLSAGGKAGLQDDSGGGSGGSVWVTAGALAGAGAITAEGGAGELYEGGGGGGGRIAIYAPINAFGGIVSAVGGAGWSPGQAGSIYYAVKPVMAQVVSTTPVGILTGAVSTAEVVFSAPVDPYSVAVPNIGLTAPGGLPVSDLIATPLSPYRFQISFPAQTAQGEYVLTVGPQVVDFSGQPISQVCTSTFAIAWAAVQGTIADTNGQPVPDVLLQPDGGVPGTTTDANGHYVLSLPPAGDVLVVPSKAGLMFVPGSRTYNNVTTSISNENYLAVSTVMPMLTTQVQGNSFTLSWYGIPGVTYQPLYSTNLVDWLPYDNVLQGTNGPLQLLVPIDTDPTKYFRMGASY